MAQSVGDRPLEPGRPARRVQRLRPEVRQPERPASAGGEHEIVWPFAGQDWRELARDRAGQRDTSPLMCFRRSEHQPAVDLGERFDHFGPPAQQIDAADPSAGRLTPAKSGVGQGQDQGSVVQADRLRERGNLAVVERSNLPTGPRPLPSPAPNPRLAPPGRQTGRPRTRLLPGRPGIPPALSHRRARGVRPARASRTPDQTGREDERQAERGGGGGAVGLRSPRRVAAERVQRSGRPRQVGGDQLMGPLVGHPEHLPDVTQRHPRAGQLPGGGPQLLGRLRLRVTGLVP